MMLVLWWVFCTDIRTDNEFCFIHHWLIGFYNRGGKFLLRGTDWFLMYNRLRFVFKTLILSYHHRLGLPSGLFPSGFLTKTMYTRLSSPPIRSTCLTHLILLDIITRTILGEQYRSLCCSLCSFLHSLHILNIPMSLIYCLRPKLLFISTSFWTSLIPITCQVFKVRFAQFTVFRVLTHHVTFDRCFSSSYFAVVAKYRVNFINYHKYLFL
jgi:hypothetical protein